MDARGQTLHDYVAGISVFVLTVAVVLGLLPSVVAPFNADTGAAESTVAERIGEQVVANLSLSGAPNTLESDNVTSLFAKDEAGLRARFGLRDVHHVNLTLTNLNGSTILVDPGGTPQTAGASAATEDVSSAARIVRLDEPGFDCRPACRLLVRVW